MRIVILAQHFPPETTPTGRRAHDLATSLAGLGHRVVVVTGRPNHPAALRRYFCHDAAPREQPPEGYVVLRVPLFRSPDPQAWKRLLTYFSFMLAAAWRGICQPRPDVVIAISPLPAGLAALALHWRRRAPLIFDLQDIWPDSARAVGAMKNGFGLRCLGHIEKLLYLCCARVVVISEGFRRYVAGLGVPEDRIAVIPNGVDAAMFHRAAPEARITRTGPLRDRFVVGYVGNLGLAQGLGTVLEAACRLRQEPVSFLLVGEGVEKRKLVQRSRHAGLENVRFMHGVPRRRVPGLLAACDALLVILRDDPLFQITIPSKVYEYMAAGKPVLCSVGGECAALILQAGCGLTIRPSDPQALSSAILRLKGDSGAARAMGESGASWVRVHCDRPVLMGAYHDLLCNVLGGSRAEISVCEGLKPEASAL